ncbi:MAG: ORF6N domain-containing protein [Armatimonadota bacterium]
MWSKVILDADLTQMYGVTTKQLNQDVKRNKNWFREKGFTKHRT